jgi:hypothetical protein
MVSNTAIAVPATASSVVAGPQDGGGGVGVFDVVGDDPEVGVSGVEVFGGLVAAQQSAGVAGEGSVVGEPVVVVEVAPVVAVVACEAFGDEVVAFAVIGGPAGDA